MKHSQRIPTKGRIMTKATITTKLTGPQITALKHKFEQLLKEGAKHQYAHYELQRKLNEKKADENVKAIHDTYAPAIAAITAKIDALYAKKRELDKKRDAQMEAEREKLFGPAPRFGTYQVERLANEHWTNINLKLQFCDKLTADNLVKMLSDEVVKILNAKG